MFTDICIVCAFVTFLNKDYLLNCSLKCNKYVSFGHVNCAFFSNFFFSLRPTSVFLLIT